MVQHSTWVADANYTSGYNFGPKVANMSAAFLDDAGNIVNFKLEAGHLNYYANGIKRIANVSKLEVNGNTLWLDGTSMGNWLSTAYITLSHPQAEDIQKVLAFFHQASADNSTNSTTVGLALRRPHQAGQQSPKRSTNLVIAGCLLLVALAALLMWSCRRSQGDSSSDSWVDLQKRGGSRTLSRLRAEDDALMRSPINTTPRTPGLLRHAPVDEPGIISTGIISGTYREDRSGIRRGWGASLAAGDRL